VGDERRFGRVGDAGLVRQGEPRRCRRRRGHGLSAGGATFYRFPTFQNPSDVPLNPGRVVQVNDSDVNPGTRDYAVTVKFRTTKPDGNIIQKGQSACPTSRSRYTTASSAASSAVPAAAVRQLGRRPSQRAVAHHRCERTADKVG
jgi:hypothetical protein